ncbi:MAG: flavodoxin domain-containing protein [Paludibacteraceae bacterium]
MKTAVIYATTHGTVEKVANYIFDKLPDQDIKLVKLEKDTNIDLASFDNIILGGSIYLGDIQEILSHFCKNNIDLLLTKNIGLFVCGIEPELVRQDAELEMAYPRNLYEHAQATAFVGGEVILEHLNLSQKFIAKTLFKIKKSTSFIHYDLVDVLIYQMELTTSK